MFKNFILNRTAENEATYKQYNNALPTLIQKLKLITLSQNLVINKMVSKRCGNILDPSLSKKNQKAKFSWKACNKWENNKYDKEIAIALSTYFTNIKQDLSGEIIPTEQSFMDYLPNRVPKSIFMKPLDDIEIATEITLLHNKKSVLDILNISITKYIKDEIIPTLVLIFNPIRPGLFSHSPGSFICSEARMPKIKVNINGLKLNFA